jgi:hypothetical protein
VWGTRSDIVWGTRSDIVWGTRSDIVWGTRSDIVWGTRSDTGVGQQCGTEGPETGRTDISERRRRPIPRDIVERDAGRGSPPYHCRRPLMSVRALARGPAGVADVGLTRRS